MIYNYIKHIDDITIFAFFIACDALIGVLLYRIKKNDKGNTTQLAYPKTMEKDGNLYIIYSQGKEDCAMTIIPLDALAD